MDIPQEYMDLVDDLWYGYVRDGGNGPEIKDIITFLCGCRKMKTLTMFRLTCLSVSHFATPLPAVELGSAVSSSEGPSLAEIFEPVQNYMLSCSPENNIFTDPESINYCVELVEDFAGTAWQSGYDPWSYVDT